MDLAKIQADFIKRAFKVTRKETLVHGEINGWKMIGNEFRVFFIPEMDCLLDLDTLDYLDYSKRIKTEAIKNLIDTEGAETLEVTSKIIRDEEFKRDIRILKLGEQSICINDKYFKEFTDKCNEPMEFKGKRRNSAVSVWKNHSLVGIIMPILCKEEK